MFGGSNFDPNSFQGGNFHPHHSYHMMNPFGNLGSNFGPNSGSNLQNLNTHLNHPIQNHAVTSRPPITQPTSQPITQPSHSTWSQSDYWNTNSYSSIDSSPASSVSSSATIRSNSNVSEYSRSSSRNSHNLSSSQQHSPPHHQQPQNSQHWTDLNIKHERLENGYVPNAAQGSASGTGTCPQDEEDMPEELLFNSPGIHFDPSRRSFSQDELRPQPIIRKRRKVITTN